MSPIQLAGLLAAAGAALALVAYLVARRLMTAGYGWADALVVEAVTLIGGIGAVQSYTALRWLALLGDLPEWQADVAPATVDVFAAVLGLAALSARRAGKRDRYADWLALGYSVAAVLANLSAAALDVANSHITGPRIAVVLVWHTAPVVTFLLGSHWLMRRPAAPAPEGATESGRREPAEATVPASTLTTAAPSELAELADRAPDGGPAGSYELRQKARADMARRSARSARAASALKERANGGPRRAPNGSRADQVRALLAEPDGRALTGDDIGARLGIDPGYARRLRSEVERADEPERRPRVLEVAAAPAAAAEEA